MKISPSLMCMDIWRIQEQITYLDKVADMLHVDVFDGRYTKNFCYSPNFVKQIRPYTTLPIDVHLCIENPQDFFGAFVEAGADLLCVHADQIYRDAYRQITTIHDMGCKVGIVLNPAIPLSMVEPYLHLVDKLTVMTIDVGFAGQQLIPDTLKKIRSAVQYREAHGCHYLVEADGQCNQKNFRRIIDTDVDVMIVGASGLFDLADTIEESWAIMRKNIANA